MQRSMWESNKLTKAAIIIFLLSIATALFTSNWLFVGIPFLFLFCFILVLNWKLAYWMLLASVPISITFYFFNDTLSTSLPDEPIMWIMLLVGVFVIAHQPQRIKKEWLSHPLIILIGLQFVWMLIAIGFSSNLLLSVKFGLAKVWFLSSFLVFPYLVFKEKKDFKIGFILFFVGVFITTLIIFTRHALIGFDFLKIYKAIGELYQNHVDYSTVLSMLFPAMCATIPLTKKWSWPARLLWLLVIVFFLPAIYLTYARAAILALLFAGVIYLAIRWRLVNWVMPLFYTAIILLISFMIRNNKYIDFRPNYDHTFMHFTFTDHIIATFRGEDMSSMERLYRWVAGARMSTEHPIVGCGPNTFYYNYKPYAVTSFRTYVSRNLEHSTSHNYFLYMLVEQGWPALILYGLLVMLFFYIAQKTYHRFSPGFYRQATIAVATMFAAGFVNNFFSELIENHKVGALFYLSISLLVILDLKSRKEANPLH
jgi:O-antigen ligase